MARNNIPSLIRQIGREQGLSDAQIRAMIATSKQESGWDPNSVGDGGTSFGLFQHHIGGAGGSTEKEARRYLDPVTSITERAKWFKKNNIRGGTGAAALQRPADPSGYARSVDAILGGLGQNVGMGSAGPVRRSPGTQQGGGGVPTSGSDSLGKWADSYLADYLYKDDPMMRSLYSSILDTSDETPQPTQPTAPGSAGGGQASSEPVGNYKGGKLHSYKDVVSLGQKFGLRLDGGNAQTTGGSHTAGSLHYENRAVDFGDAKNSPDKLKAFAKFLAANSKRLGINEIAYNPLGWGYDAGHRVPGMTWEGHNDHLHVGINGG